MDVLLLDQSFQIVVLSGAFYADAYSALGQGQRSIVVLSGELKKQLLHCIIV